LKVNYDYPNNSTEAYNLLVNYKNYNSKRSLPQGGGLDQVAFITDGKRIKSGGSFPNIKV